MSHSLEFEGSPATAASITVQLPALLHCAAGTCSIAATHDAVTIRVRQQQLEVRSACPMMPCAFVMPLTYYAAMRMCIHCAS